MKRNPLEITRLGKVRAQEIIDLAIKYKDCNPYYLLGSIQSKAEILMRELNCFETEIKNEKEN